MKEQFDTIVIGAGQAGLSVGYYLARRGRGFVILEANQTPVNSVAAFNAVLAGDAKAKGVILLLVKRDKQTLFKPVPLAEKQ